MSDEPEPSFKRRTRASALFIPAGLFLGTGTGWAFNNLVPGMFVGLGAGLLVFAFIIISLRD